MKKLIFLGMVVVMLLGSTQYIQATELDSAERETENGTETVTETDKTNAFVIVLDPGHDYDHGGARYDGLSETAINLKIAQYCYEELSTYSNVIIYMTRYSNECPYPEALEETNGARTDNRRRVDFAASVGADAYVALHLNAFTSPSANGASVFVPNFNYLPEVGKEGQALGRSILNKLVALGLKNKDICTRLSEDGTVYADGSPADYYGVIKRAKDHGIPGIIVEHCFMSSEIDTERFLKTEEGIKKLAMADAQGIAEYYGLVKDGTTLKPDKLYKVEFKKDGKLVCTQYVRDGYSATQLDEEYMGITNVTYSRSLSNITSDTVIHVTYDSAPQQNVTPKPTPTPTPDSETTTESETEDVTETESETESETVTEEMTESETVTEDIVTEVTETESEPSEDVADTNPASKLPLFILTGVAAVACVSVAVVFIIKKIKRV